MQYTLSQAVLVLLFSYLLALPKDDFYSCMTAVCLIFHFIETDCIFFWYDFILVVLIKL